MERFTIEIGKTLINSSISRLPLERGRCRESKGRQSKNKKSSRKEHDE
jgi:hypothetical protein